jgi:hypothetical protein
LGQIRAHQDQRLVGGALLERPDSLGGGGLNGQGGHGVGGEEHRFPSPQALQQI